MTEEMKPKPTKKKGKPFFKRSGTYKRSISSRKAMGSWGLPRL